VEIRAARIDDVPAIQALIRTHAERGKMVLRTLDEIYSNLREYIVSEMKGRIVGVAATHIFWSDLAELKCLAVDEGSMGKGIGSALLEGCLQQMSSLGVGRLFTLTRERQFFVKNGYAVIEKERLPRFIWGECVRCPTFPVCNEDALIRDVPKRS
jgi:amino-acid N-acetyltransferase